MSKPSSKPNKPESVGVDEMTRILVEVGTGKEPATPDTPEMARLRKAFTASYAKAKREGMAIQIPSE